MSKPFGEELLFQKAEAGTLTPDEQRRLAKRGRERLSKIARWCEQNAVLKAENERLKEAIRRLADQDATLSVCDGNVIVEMDATLTDAEREAVLFAARRLEISYVEERAAAACVRAAATLRGLLKRLGPADSDVRSGGCE